MQILINTDHNIQSGDDVTAAVETALEHSLRNIHHHITRVEVHLSDENAGKGGTNDKRCDGRETRWPPAPGRQSSGGHRESCHHRRRREVESVARPYAGPTYQSQAIN
jgi:hypothetical protein